MVENHNSSAVQNISAGRLCSLVSITIGIIILLVLWYVQGFDALLIMTFAVAFVGIVSGICAVKMRKNIKSGTKKIAFFGIIMNGALLCHLAILMSIHGVFFNFAKINRNRCLNNLNTIKMQMVYYASCNGGLYPALPGAEGLIGLRRFVQSEKNQAINSKSQIYYCPAATSISLGKGGDVRSLVYLNGFYTVSDMDKEKYRIPVVLDRPGNHQGHINVLFADGSVVSFKSKARNCVAFIEFLNGKYAYDKELLNTLRGKAVYADKAVPSFKKRPATKDIKKTLKQSSMGKVKAGEQAKQK